MIAPGFYKLTLPLDINLFTELFQSIDFESVTKGRLGNNLVRVDGKGVPIVRTTTKYTTPAYSFSAVHDRVVEAINRTLATADGPNIPAQEYNNALLEVYDCRYSKMNYHSDQCLDIEADSYIGLFSCYTQPDQLSESTVRTLMVKDKITQEEYEITLTHHSVVLFSVATNAWFQHKIVLKPMPHSKPMSTDNQWLGLTFRKSKTYIQFRDNLPYFPNGDRLSLADEEQESEFFKLRGQENKALDYAYPHLTYTLSVADTMMPKTR